MIQEIINLIADCVERPIEEIQAMDNFREYEEWDSLAYLSVIASIDENYDLVIPGEEFKNFITISDIASYVESHYSTDSGKDS